MEVLVTLLSQKGSGGEGCGRGVANVERKWGRSVPIVLWEITPECEKALDLYEGFPRLYVKRIADVLASKGHVVRATIYVMAEQYEKCPAEPSGAYLRTIWQGYLDHQISLDALRQALLENARELSDARSGSFRGAERKG